MKYKFRYLKCFESWVSERPRILPSTDAEDINNVKKFVQEHNLSHLILDIWEHGKNNFNAYPYNINSHNFIEYISKDACRLIIDITDKGVTIKKVKIEKDNHDKWANKELHNGKFSFPVFNNLMQHNGHIKSKTIPLTTLPEKPHGVAA